MRLARYVISIIAVLILSYWSISHLLLPGFFPIHDDTQVARVFVMHKALQEGIFPVRWVSELGYGYGYPIFNFYAPFAYYVGGLIQFWTSDALAATKLMMLLGVLLSGVSMYYLAKSFWGRIPAIATALLYVYAPYHAVNVYVRGAVAEYWSYAFLPLVFLGFWKLYKEARFRYVVLTALSLAAVILSHNLTAFILVPFVVLAMTLMTWQLWQKKQTAQVIILMIAVALGLLLSAFYWVPALFEMSYTDVAGQIGGKADFRDHFVCLPQLWESNWGFGGSAPGCLDGLSFRIGKIHIGFALLALILFITKFRANKKAPVVLLSFLFLALSVFLTLDWSRIVWENVSPMAYLQYPWRFLALITLFSSFLAGSAVWALGEVYKKQKNVVLLAALVLTVVAIAIFYSKLFISQTILRKSSDAYMNTQTLRFTTSKLSDEYMPKNFDKPDSSQEIVMDPFIVQGNADIRHLSTKTGYIDATITAAKPTTVLVNVAYFPGWTAFLNGKKATYEITSKGLLINLPEGEHEVKFVLRQTPVEQAANALSLAGVVACIVGILYARKRRKL